MRTAYWVGSDGKARILPMMGGITYDFQIGDPCMGLMGDHIEPGVSTKNKELNEDIAYNHLACIGNEAVVVSGDAKGAKGYVTGKHGGIEHVMIYFDKDTLEKLCIDDNILVKAWGQGLTLNDYPLVSVMNIDPGLLEKLDIKEKDGQLYVPVKTVVPARLMGSGLGSAEMKSGDYDIMTRDRKAFKKYNLGSLCFGDLVFIEDHANVYGPDFKKGAGSVGVIIHGDSFLSGHGPGVTIILTAEKDILQPIIDPTANIAKYIK
jgi:hypothetical protein